MTGIIKWIIVNYVTKHLNDQDISVVIWMVNQLFFCYLCHKIFKHLSNLGGHVEWMDIGHTSEHALMLELGIYISYQRCLSLLIWKLILSLEL